MTDAQNRLRTPPRERFAEPVKTLDLLTVAEELGEEAGSTIHGHRQIALYHHGRFTVALFKFDRGGKLADHSAKGEVMIQSLEGRLKLTTDGVDEGTRLEPGRVTFIAPNVVHAVEAETDALMLLTVALEQPD